MSRRALIVGGDPASSETIGEALTRDGWTTMTHPAPGFSDQMVGLVEQSAVEEGLDLVVWSGGDRPAEGPIDTTDVDTWWDIVAANLDLPFYLAQASTPHLRRGRGSLILITSSIGVTGWPEESALAAASAGTIGLAKSLARELAPEVRVNVVIAPIDPPTGTEFEFAQPLEREPVGIGGVAGTVAFLASARGAAYTGAVLHPTGGATIS